MELKYVWVKDYKMFKDFEVNLSHSGTDCFTYDGKSFKIQTKEKPVLNFGKNISSITAIAGQNGSGKSSLCELLIHAIATFTEGGMRYSTPFKGIICIGNYIFCQEDLNGLDPMEIGLYKLTYFKESPLEDMPILWRQENDKVGFVYYSDVFDWRSDHDEFNLKNISTERYLINDIHYGPSFTFRHDLRIPQEHRGDEISDLEAFYIEENYHYTKFVLNFPGFSPFNDPKSFLIEISYSGSNKHLYNGRFHEYEEEIFNQLYKNKYERNIENELDTNFELIKNMQLQMYKLNIANLLLSDEKFPDDLISKFIFSDDIPIELDSEHSVLGLAKSFTKILEKAKYSEKLYPSHVKSNFERTNDWRFYLMSRFLVENTSETSILLRNHISSEEEILKYNYHFRKRVNNYYLEDGLSSGEKSFYSLFSRLYRVIKENQLNKYDIKKSLVIFIDEAEIGFHPAWKKKFLKWIVEFFNHEFIDIKVQLILTSHSPYFLSDLHSDNLILLKKNELGNSKIISASSMRTFGANIHELLTESFFLDDGLIGEFAKDKINELIEFLNNPANPSTVNEKSAQQLINIVGEPLIRDILMAKYKEKFQSDEDIQIQIEELQSRLKNRKS